MSQQVPFNNSGVSQGNLPQENGVVASGGHADAAPGYVPQNVPVAGMEQYGGGNGYWQPPQGPQTFARHRAPMIDPIESAKLTPQIVILLVLAGLRRHWKWSFPMGLILGVLAAGSLYLAFPLQYEARATIQISSLRPDILDEGRPMSMYEEFVNTQLAFIRSPAVIDKALDSSDVAKLPIVQKQVDKRGWLTRKLGVRPDGKSEIVAISVATEATEASERIVNAIVSAYFSHIEDVERRRISSLVASLRSERQRCQNEAGRLQDSIRQRTNQIAVGGGVAGRDAIIGGLAQGESLYRDLANAEAQLYARLARRKATQERIEQPSIIPLEVLAHVHPEFNELNAQKEVILQNRNRYLEAVSDENNPRIRQFNRQIEVLEERIRGITSSSTGDNELMAGSFRAHEIVNAWLLDQEIRQQQILVEELKARYADQLINAATRSEGAADVSFESTQLARVDRTLDAIEDRLNSIQMQQRAPGQVTLLSEATSSQPNRMRRLSVVGMGTAVLAFIPLLLSIAIERMKPRLYHVSQVRRAAPQVLIGEIMEPPISWVQGTTFRRRLARYRESVHNWCTHLLLSDPFRSCRTISIASVAGDDGKTFLAVQIAAAMAQMKTEGPVLLIDGDMRVGRLHLLFGNEEPGVGLADVLAFRNGPGEAIVESEKEPNLSLVSAGQLDTTPYELLGDGRFRELLDTYEQRFSLIIVVLPPVANAAESLIMAASTDSTLLCVRQGETVLAAMEDVYRKLVNTGAAVDGIVVKDIPYYQMAGRDGGFADKLEQIRLSHLLQYAD